MMASSSNDSMRKKKDLHFVQDILAVGGYLERAGGSALKSG